MVRFLTATSATSHESGEAYEGQEFKPQDCDVTWVDSAGVGHPANEAGGFPAPTAEEASMCLGGQPEPIDACAQCQCDACATPVIECAVDADCSAALECFGACTTDDCTHTCVDPYSSSLGLLIQMQGCIDYRCPACKTPSNGG